MVVGTGVSTGSVVGTAVVGASVVGVAVVGVAVVGAAVVGVAVVGASVVGVAVVGASVVYLMRPQTSLIVWWMLLRRLLFRSWMSSTNLRQASHTMHFLWPSSL